MYLGQAMLGSCRDGSVDKAFTIQVQGPEFRSPTLLDNQAWWALSCNPNTSNEKEKGDSRIPKIFGVYQLGIHGSKQETPLSQSTWKVKIDT